MEYILKRYGVERVEKLREEFKVSRNEWEAFLKRHKDKIPDRNILRIIVKGSSRPIFHQAKREKEEDHIYCLWRKDKMRLYVTNDYEELEQLRLALIEDRMEDIPWPALRIDWRRGMPFGTTQLKREVVNKHPTLFYDKTPDLDCRQPQFEHPIRKYRRDVLYLLRTGHTYQEIAYTLGIEGVPNRAFTEIFQGEGLYEYISAWREQGLILDEDPNSAFS